MPKDVITEFAERTKHYLLQNQFRILIEKYTDQFSEVANFANKYCAIRFESDCPIIDIIDPILQIYNNQRLPDQPEAQFAKMKPFLKAICSNDANLPKEIKNLNSFQRDELKQLCTSLQ